MFVVKSHVISEEVERSVIGKCLGDFDTGSRVPRSEGLTLEDVVFGYEVAGTGVQ